MNTVLNYWLIIELRLWESLKHNAHKQREKINYARSSWVNRVHLVLPTTSWNSGQNTTTINAHTSTVHVHSTYSSKVWWYCSDHQPVSLWQCVCIVVEPQGQNLSVCVCACLCVSVCLCVTSSSDWLPNMDKYGRNRAFHRRPQTRHLNGLKL